MVKWTYTRSGLILVDPSTSTFHVREGLNNRLLPSRLFQGGFEDFLSRSTATDNVCSKPGPQRRSLLEDLIFYMRSDQSYKIEKDAPSLLSLSNYPLRIAAAEWMVYLRVMYHSTKQYEFTPGTISAALEQISTLYADLSSLQKWGRRNLATRWKLRYILNFLDSGPGTDADGELRALLIKDYSYIASSIDMYGGRLNDMVPIVTSMIQIIDSQRSLLETANISRLTHLALVFVPLSFVSGLFSMNDSIAPGGRLFWLYFAVSIPLCITVFLFARPPIAVLDSLAKAIWTSKRPKQLKGQSLPAFND